VVIQSRWKLNGSQYFLHTIYCYYITKPFERLTRHVTATPLQSVHYVQDKKRQILNFLHYYNPECLWEGRAIFILRLIWFQNRLHLKQIIL
jgi:hypothetical protein